MRKNIRLRKEYLWKKEQQAKSLAVFENKRKIKNAIEVGKSIPTELRGEERNLRKQINLDDDYTFNKPVTDVDDEYFNAGVIDPKICITTSRDPSSKLKQFAKEVRLIFPNSSRINRGSYKIREIVSTVRENEFTDLVVLHETRGKPDALTVCHLPHGPTATFTLYNVVTRHDILSSEDSTAKKTVSEAYPHLIFDNFSTKLGYRVESILKFLFPVPKVSGDESKRVMSFINRDDFISYRHHVFKKVEGVSGFEPGIRKPEDIEIEEIGPRFEMQLYQIKLGTIDQPEADIEYIRHFYMNTAHKKKRLATV